MPRLLPLLLLAACNKESADDTDGDTDTDGAPCDMYGWQSAAAGEVGDCHDAPAPYDPPPAMSVDTGHMTTRWLPICADGSADCDPEDEVRCFDGTRPAYHVDPAECLATATCSDAHRWVFFFQGGGSCGTFDQCSPSYASPGEAAEMSTGHPTYGAVVADHIGGDGILSERADNTFRMATRVKIDKCGYDRFSGDNTVVESVDGTDVALHFHGRRQIEAVLADLGRANGDVVIDGVTVPDFDDADAVLLSANSGGSGGLIQNVDWFVDLVHEHSAEAEVVALFDARFEPNGENEAAFEVNGNCGPTCDAYDADDEGESEALPDNPADATATLLRDRSIYEPGTDIRAMFDNWLAPGAATFDESCGVVHAADTMPCFDEGHVELNHIGADAFFHEALFDNNHTNGVVPWVVDPVEFTWDDNRWARAGRVVHQADTFVEHRAEADGDTPGKVGIFLPGHDHHVSVTDDVWFLDGAMCRRCGQPDAQCVRYHDAVVTWALGSLDMAWVEDQPERPGSGREPLSHAMTDAAYNGWRWSPSGACP